MTRNWSQKRTRADFFNGAASAGISESETDDERLEDGVKAAADDPDEEEEARESAIAAPNFCCRRALRSRSSRSESLLPWRRCKLPVWISTGLVDPAVDEGCVAVVSVSSEALDDVAVFLRVRRGFAAVGERGKEVNG